MLIPGALKGVTVLDLSRLLPGPFCSMILADHGARVIAIEDKKQYAADGLFVPTVQRNKQHMTLDLKTPEGQEIFFRLAAIADVIIEGFRPGVVERLGVDYERVRRVKPDIVYCSITGYGQNGPYAQRVGHDVNYLGYAGVLDLMGAPDRPPSIPGIQIADIAAGGMNGAIGILLALFARQRTGEGQRIDISMSDGMLAMLPVAQFWQAFSGQAPRRGIICWRIAMPATTPTPRPTAAISPSEPWKAVSGGGCAAKWAWRTMPTCSSTKPVAGRSLKPSRMFS
jgi:crotonobetainyl-CoA:carnitine CoA-transferase CaiB-like acyl-CoA transferase